MVETFNAKILMYRGHHLMRILGQIRKSPQNKDYVSDRSCNNNACPQEIMLKYIFMHFLCDNLRAKTYNFWILGAPFFGAVTIFNFGCATLILL